jgi:hypothetical protein
MIELGGEKLYEIKDNKLYFMEDIFLSNYKKLYVKDLNDFELKKINNIITELRSSYPKTRYIEDLRSETASEYHITLRIQDKFKDFQVFQDSLQGEFTPLLSFINSINKESFDSIFNCSPVVQNLHIDGLINHYNDTILVNSYTKFNVWKQLIINEIEILENTREIFNDSYDYRFIFGYDLGYIGDSICQLGVINNDIYLTYKNGKMGVIKDASCVIQPLLY